MGFNSGFKGLKS